MSRMHGIQITAAEAVTAVGWTAVTTAASVRAGVSRVLLHGLYPDEEGHPLSVAPLPNDEGYADPFDRVGPAAIGALRALMKTFDARYDEGRPCHLLLGGAHPDRGGAIYEKPEDLLPVSLAAELATLFPLPTVQVFGHGNPSGLFALETADEIIARDPRALCVVGAVDSLLDEELLEGLEDEERLECEGGSPHGISPGEAVGFVLVESTRFTTSRLPLAVVDSVVTGHEPHPYRDEEPTLAEGLTAVCEQALRDARLAPSDVDAVLIDLDGEHHRAAEWSNTEVRCLGASSGARTLLVHPADCYGSIGAASGIVLTAIVAAARGWLDGTDLVLASDDEGPRGAAVLRRQWRGN